METESDRMLLSVTMKRDGLHRDLRLLDKRRAEIYSELRELDDQYDILRATDVASDYFAHLRKLFGADKRFARIIDAAERDLAERQRGSSSTGDE